MDDHDKIMTFYHSFLPASHTSSNDKGSNKYTICPLQKIRTGYNHESLQQQEMVDLNYQMVLIMK